MMAVDSVRPRHRRTVNQKEEVDDDSCLGLTRFRDFAAANSKLYEDDEKVKLLFSSQFM